MCLGLADGGAEKGADAGGDGHGEDTPEGDAEGALPHRGAAGAGAKGAEDDNTISETMATAGATYSPKVKTAASSGSAAPAVKVAAEVSAA